jgi:hypothetical protein
MQRLRGEVKGLPLTEREHTLLYERAIEGSRKDAARVTGTNTNSAHHMMASIFQKLGVEDLVSAFWAMGWLRPLPYGVNATDVRDEQLAEGQASEQQEAAFWERQSHHREREHEPR